jgi:hypothetical protein
MILLTYRLIFRKRNDKNMKKRKALFIALILCVSIALSLAPTAFAAPSAEPAVTSAEAQPNAPDAPVIIFNDAPVNTAVSVKLTYNKSSDANIRLMYKINEDGEWLDYSEPFDVEENAVISAKAILSDSTQSQVSTAEIKCIDKVPPMPPTIYADTTTWVKSLLSVTLGDASDAESGFLRCEYRIGETGEWIEYYDKIDVTEPTVLFARSVDKAMNRSAEVSITLTNFDTTAPNIDNLQVTFGNEGGANVFESSLFGTYFKDPAICTIDGAVDAESGVLRYEYQFVQSGSTINDLKWIKYNPNTKPQIDFDFIGFVYARAVDAAGNISSAAASAGVVVDSTPPEIGEITKSETKITGSQVVVNFAVTDNISIDTIKVNNSYVGIYSPEFTAFRNGEYKITATDRAGNISTKIVLIENIQTTPFNILTTVNSLKEERYTPSTWAALQKQVAELNNILAVESNGAMVDSYSEQVLLALEGLILRGDGTKARELIERVDDMTASDYTKSSWAKIDEAKSVINSVLDDAESSQTDVDTARKQLEGAVTELRLKANFTALDRVLAKVEALNPNDYPADKFLLLAEAANKAKQLDRQDTAQEDADAVYNQILELMGALKPVKEPEQTDTSAIWYLALGVLAVAAIVALSLYIFMRRRNRPLPPLYTGANVGTGRNAGKDYPPNRNDAQEFDNYAEIVNTEQTGDPEQAFYFEAPGMRQKKRRGGYEEQRQTPPRKNGKGGSGRSNGGSHGSSPQFGDIDFGGEGEYSEWEQE